MIDDSKKLSLQRLAEDKALLEALRDELISSLDNRKHSLELTNENLGAEVRARETAKAMIEAGIRNIEKLKTTKVEKKEILNPGK